MPDQNSPEELQTAAAEPEETNAFWKTLQWMRDQWWLVLLIVAFSGLGALWWSLRLKRPLPSSGAQISIAVLTFEYDGEDRAQQYLCWAIPDEMALGLSRETNLAVRPFTYTRTYSPEKLDIGIAGRELHADYLVAGKITRHDATLYISVTLFDADTRRIKWHQQFMAPVDSDLKIRDTLARAALPELAATLGAPLTSVAIPSATLNEQGYDLYLRSAALPLNGALNREGIVMLQRSLELEPRYAPAWLALGERLRLDALANTDTADAQLAQASDALTRALELDDEFAQALEMHAKVTLDRGRLNDAYDVAKRLVELRQGSSYAHLLLADVLRHGGMLREAASNCDIALKFDPREWRLRSCSMAYEMLGQNTMAERFTHVDLGSEYSSWRHILISLDQGRTDAALSRLGKVRDSCLAEVLRSYLNKAPAEKLRSMSNDCEHRDNRAMIADDHWMRARVFAYAQQPDAALLEVTRAQARGDCGYPALESDPLLKAVRELPAFKQREEQAQACAASFRQHVQQRSQ
jgi:TolB-like protein